MRSLTAHDVTFHATHAVLQDLAQDLAATLTAPVGARIALHVGMHTGNIVQADGPRDPAVVTIGLQTEQLFDARGVALWKAHLAARIAAKVAQYDVVLDLSSANRRVYAALPPALQGRVLFGPHIFPATPPDLAIRPDGPCLFVGSFNQRRRQIRRRLLRQGIAVSVVPLRTFGTALRAELQPAAAMMNIHFAQGLYTEYPRLLKSVLAGKPFISEDLADPLVAMEHYVPLARANAGPAALTRTYHQLCDLVCSDYSLQGFLAGVIARHPRNMT
jgi:hypothetical protein